MENKKQDPNNFQFKHLGNAQSYMACSILGYNDYNTGTQEMWYGKLDGEYICSVAPLEGVPKVDSYQALELLTTEQPTLPKIDERNFQFKHDGTINSAEACTVLFNNNATLGYVDKWYGKINGERINSEHPHPGVQAVSPDTGLGFLRGEIWGYTRGWVRIPHNEDPSRATSNGDSCELLGLPPKETCFTDEDIELISKALAISYLKNSKK